MIDWDTTINHHIKDVPYIWYPSQEWGKCSRTYIFNINYTEEERYETYKIFENLKNNINKMKCEHSEDILYYFKMVTNIYSSNQEFYKNLNAIQNLLLLIGKKIEIIDKSGNIILVGTISLRMNGKIISDKKTPGDIMKGTLSSFVKLLEYHHLPSIHPRLIKGKLSIK